MLEVGCSQQEAKQAVEEQAGQWPLVWYCSEPVGQNAAVLREQMHKAGASRALAVQRADNGVDAVGPSSKAVLFRRRLATAPALRTRMTCVTLAARQSRVHLGYFQIHCQYSPCMSQRAASASPIFDLQT